MESRGHLSQPRDVTRVSQIALLLTPPCFSAYRFLCLENDFFLLSGPNTCSCSEVPVNCPLPCATQLQPLRELSTSLHP